jgi:hypothetical protein
VGIAGCRVLQRSAGDLPLDPYLVFEGCLGHRNPQAADYCRRPQIYMWRFATLQGSFETLYATEISCFFAVFTH